jgi:hypothetical protein
MHFEILLRGITTLQITTWYSGLQAGIAAFIESIITYLPNVIAFTLILLIGYLIVKAFVKVVSWGMKRISLEKQVGHTRIGQAVERSGHTFTDIVVTTVKWIFYFIIIVYAISALKIPPLTASMDAILAWIPELIGVAIIVFAGLLIGSWIGKGLENTLPRYGVQGGRLIGMIVEVIIYLFAFDLAIIQLGIARGIIFVFSEAMSWGLAAALAVGLGGALLYALKDILPGMVSGSTTVASTLRPGQTVTIEGMPNVGGDGGKLTGEVSSVGMFNTVFKRRGGGFYIVPNNLLMDKTLIVESGEEPRPFEHGVRERVSDLNNKFESHMDDVEQQQQRGSAGNNGSGPPQYIESGQGTTYEDRQSR